MNTFWKIEEVVVHAEYGDLYIVLDGIYQTEAAAKAAIATFPSNQNMRAVLYTKGQHDGAIRAALTDD